jgi:ABC-type maltose transport system permease subunit
MAKIRTKAQNRLISIGAIAVFVVAVILMVVGIIWVVNLSIENNRLNEIKNSLVEQIENQEGYEELHEDDYYTVYVEDGYTVFDDTDGDPLIVYSK